MKTDTHNKQDDTQNEGAGRDCPDSAGSRLAELCRELFDMLDSYEVSDSGREFRPTTIQSCRVMDCAKLEKILPEMKKLAFENVEDSNE